MKFVTRLLAVSFVISALAVGRYDARGAGDDSMLLQFWKANPNADESSSIAYVAELRRDGVDDVNSLAPFVSPTNEFSLQALQSMALIAPQSKPLDLGALTNVICLATNFLADMKVEVAAMKLLLCYYPQQPVVQLFFDQDISHLEMNDLKDKEMATLSSYLLYLVGEKFGHMDGNPAPPPFFATLFGQKYVAVCNPMGMAVPMDNTNSIAVMLSAMRWPLYEDKQLAVKCADVLLGCLSKPDRIQRFVAPSVFPGIMDFLLNRSKASPDDLAKKIADLCARDDAMGKMVFWSLHEAKNSAVADKAMDILKKSGQDSDLFAALQSGTLTRQTAYIAPFEEIFQTPPP